MDFAFFWETIRELARGIPLTLALGLGSVGIGMILAAMLASARVWGSRGLAFLARAYVFAFRGTPLLVQIFLIYYGLSQFPWLRASFLWPFLRDPHWCALLALSLNTAAYGAEILRGGLQSVPAGQIEAARACGMSPWLAFRRIVAPLAIRQALPAYGNELVLMLKSTSLTSIVTLMEITGIAHRLIAETYRVIEVFVAAGAIYLAINFTLVQIVGFIDRRLTANMRPGRPAARRIEIEGDVA